MFNRSLHRFAVFTACCTFLLVIAGGLVTSTGSGLSVPDWPLSYGKLMPPMIGGIFYEHTHRMIAASVGILTIILAVWLAKKEKRKWVRVLGWIALGAVIVQGLLGGLTVLLMLPATVSVAHATLAQTFFSIMASIALITSRWWNDAEITRHRNVSLQNLTIFLIGTVFIQLIFGAIMRHTDSGLAIPDVPLAYGQIFPSLSSEAMAKYNQQLIDLNVRLAADGPITADQIVIQMLHRLWALVVFAFVVTVSVKLLRDKFLPKRIRRFAILLIFLVIIQIGLGALTIISRKAVDVTTAHVVTGALLLVSCVLLMFHLLRINGFKLHQFSFSFFTKEAIT
jgi:heme a synthase